MISFRRVWWAPLLVAVLGLLWAVVPVQAIPPLPQIYWGYVTVNGAPVPDGTRISAFVVHGAMEIACGYTTTFTDSGQSVYSLAVNGDDDETPAKDGASEGDTIYFRIGEGAGALLAQQTGTFQSGGSPRNVNLSASFSTPTPTVTPTPTPTRTPASHRILLPFITKANSGTGQFVMRTFQLGMEGYAGAEDTYMHAWQPAQNFGQSGELIVSAYEVYNSLLQFDLSSIPATSLVGSARLELYVSSRSSEASLPVSVYRVNRHWTEHGVTYLSAGPENWQTAGCSGASDRESAPLGTVELMRTAWWYQWDVTPFVRDWVRTPAANAGVLLVGSSASGQAMVEYRFASSQSVTPTQRPKLIVSYWLPSL